MAKVNEKEAFILKSMTSLELTREAAEELWAFDNDEVDNEEVAAIETKVDASKVKAPSKIGKVLTMKAKKKADANKSEVVNTIFDAIESDQTFVNSQAMTSNKMSFQDKDGTYYSVVITKHKTKPDGFKDLD